MRIVEVKKNKELITTTEISVKSIAVLAGWLAAEPAADQSRRSVPFRLFSYVGLRDYHDFQRRFVRINNDTKAITELITPV